jgi:hypothetical protein
LALARGTPKQIIIDRADVGVDTLEEFYSTLTEREKADVRKDYLPDGLTGQQNAAPYTHLKTMTGLEKHNA